MCKKMCIAISSLLGLGVGFIGGYILHKKAMETRIEQAVQNALLKAGLEDDFDNFFDELDEDLSYENYNDSDYNSKGVDEHENNSEE